jgi:hypothetical protein
MAFVLQTKYTGFRAFPCSALTATLRRLSFRHSDPTSTPRQFLARRYCPTTTLSPAPAFVPISQRLYSKMASKGNFELLCLENPLLDIQGVG